MADLRDPAATLAAVGSLSPDGCIHLAGQAHVPTSWTKPAETIDINVVGTVNLLEAFRRVRPAARILFISTAEVYGRREGAELVPEDAPMVPESIYGISKAAGDMASRAYARHHGMAVMVARPQNHIGPGQSPIFAAASFAAQISRPPPRPRPAPPPARRQPALRARFHRCPRRRPRLPHPARTRHPRPRLQHRLRPQPPHLRTARLHVRRQRHPAQTHHPRTLLPAHRNPGHPRHRRILTELGWKPAIPFEQTVRDILAAAR
ncbi:MAG: GDP-mannose 4,6-dehydratase [Kiritimatiellia bacterium]